MNHFNHALCALTRSLPQLLFSLRTYLRHLLAEEASNNKCMITCVCRRQFHPSLVGGGAQVLRGRGVRRHPLDQGLLRLVSSDYGRIISAIFLWRDDFLWPFGELHHVDVDAKFVDLPAAVTPAHNDGQVATASRRSHRPRTATVALEELNTLSSTKCCVTVKESE